MKPLLIQGMPLTRSLRNTWREAGAIITKRLPTEATHWKEMYDRHNCDVVINLGNRNREAWAEWSELPTEHIPVFNRPEEIRAVSTPGYLREHLTRNEAEDLLPPRLTEEDLPCTVWRKGPGFGGRGKERLYTTTMVYPRDNVEDVQLEITGHEYRVITVGNKVVQAHRRYGPNGDRTYEWIGVRGLDRSVRNTVKSAVFFLFDSPLMVIGWDVIYNPRLEYSWILEGNSSPGVNGPTATRILSAIESLMTPNREEPTC